MRTNMHRLIARLNQALFPKLGENPPDRLHILYIHGLISMFHIHPASHPIDGPLPILGVLQNRRATLRFKPGNAHRLNILLAFQAKFFLHNILNRQTMAIPAPDALHAITAHRPIPWHHVFHQRSHDMPVMRQAGRERRPVIKNIRLVFRPLRNGFLKSFIFFPKLKNFFFGFIGKVRHD